LSVVRCPLSVGDDGFEPSLRYVPTSGPSPGSGPASWFLPGARLRLRGQSQQRDETTGVWECLSSDLTVPRAAADPSDTAALRLNGRSSSFLLSRLAFGRAHIGRSFPRNRGLVQSPWRTWRAWRGNLQKKVDHPKTDKKSPKSSTRLRSEAPERQADGRGGEKPEGLAGENLKEEVES
jgi:hypothetical protein